MRFYNECNKEKYCGICHNHVNENKEFEANLNFLRKQAPNTKLVICFLIMKNKMIYL